MVTELGSAASGITFGQLLRGEAEEARKLLKRLLSGSVSKAHAVMSASGLPRHLNVVLLRLYGTETYGHFDTGAVPNLLSSK